MVSVKVQAILKLSEIQVNQTCFTDESSPWLTIPVFKICANNLNEAKVLLGLLLQVRTRLQCIPRKDVMVCLSSLVYTTNPTEIRQTVLAR